MTGRTTVQNKWLFKIKPGYKDVALRYKSRLVAKGFTQHYGIDYEETFAPVVKHSSLRAVLGAVAAFNLNMFQLDVKTAFLHGELEEDIYMDQPKGYELPGREGEVCHLKKCIYGNETAAISLFILVLVLIVAAFIALLFVL